ncbi:MAG: hypothetical protein ACRETU_02435 [Steroidobacterales bacterium]
MSTASHEGSTLALLKRVLEETRAVERLIEQGEWQQAVERDAIRQRLLAEAFTQDGSRVVDEEMRVIAGELLKLNDRLVGLAEHRRRGVERESDTLQLGRRALAAYHRVHFDNERS